jgi:uncharacterized protein (TIGR02453 family)
MINKTLLFSFLEELKKNNNREWFQDNQPTYKIFKENYLELTTELLKELAHKDQRIQVLEPKKCMFRINRDIRFSKDKSPYKTNIGMWFSINSNFKNAPGYYAHLENNNSFLAGGIYCPEAIDLKKIRTEISFFHEDLNKILKDKNFALEFKNLDKNENNILKTAPKGFEKEHAGLDLLKYKSFTATKKINNNEVLNDDFVKNASNSLFHLKPLNDFLNRALFD